ncbi:Sphingomyelin phosphodiesterase B [Psilocybe cubensis]|uniref:Sphingomyelin phosphodiesterase n=2 Tax=Psilocybe cubensis TaxID=181762 RepID=A0A8H8CR60_PSICU|nr:Sphingomyelin phosphodiesterase B [Psilocybe cubensis]KAH9486374.1 Sphingomyelin phosphodiesterase B [Psilocybe cubensis]
MSPGESAPLVSMIWALRVIQVVAGTSAAVTAIQPSTFTVPGAFPTSVFSKYYNQPTATSAQPQPVISDPITHTTYPFALTDPNDIPVNDTTDPHPLPPTAPSTLILHSAFTQLESLSTSSIFGSNACARCQAALEIGKFISLATPANGPEFFVHFCEIFNITSACEVTYGQFTGVGSVLTQVVANADVGGYDGQALCQNFFSMCPSPPTVELNLTNWFTKPKPHPLPPPRKPSGKRMNVLHISDLHLDPRYSTGSEANCTSGSCCRTNKRNANSPNSILLSAPRFGAYQCDSPLSLAIAALDAIPILTGTANTGFPITLYTGDLVSHDPDNQLSR